MTVARPRPTTRSGYPYFTTITTRWNDNDQMGHVNNAVYYMYFDTAQTTFYIQSGLLDMRRVSPYVVAESGCRHLSELSYPDLLTVTTAMWPRPRAISSTSLSTRGPAGRFRSRRRRERGSPPS
jgi:hypothetical protein